jgi:hypothetical protein
MDDQNKILTYPKAQLLGSSRQKPINKLMLQSLPAINTHRKISAVWFQSLLCLF